MKTVINSTESLSKVIGILRTMFTEHKYLRITIATGRDRTLDQNKLAFSWYKQISDERGDMTPEEVHTACKCRWGFPILSRDDDEFDGLIKMVPKHGHMTLAANINCTSLMTTKQFTEYLEEIQKYFMDQNPSIILEFPKEK